MGHTTTTDALGPHEETALQQDFRLGRTCQYCGHPPYRRPLVVMGNGNRRHAGCKTPVTPQLRS